MRYALLAAAAAIAGYAIGQLFGWRAATADYVENDARLLREMADSMYEEQEDEQLEQVKQVIREAEQEIDESDGGPSAFQ